MKFELNLNLTFLFWTWQGVVNIIVVHEVELLKELEHEVLLFSFHPNTKSVSSAMWSTKLCNLL